MRLDPADAETLKDVSVQCLGKNYPLSQEAWDCLEEERKIRKEHSHGHAQPDEAFRITLNRYLNGQGENSSVQSILSNFLLTDSGETPRQRLEHFRSDVDNYNKRTVMETLTNWINPF